LIPALGKTWAPVGKTPVAKTTDKKGGVCLTSAITPTGRMVFRMEKASINSTTFIDFLAKLMIHHKGKKIVLVCDRAPAHTAKKVGTFVEENSSRFALFYLPSYSPNLNPDEHVWRYLKRVKLTAHQVLTKKEFKPFVSANMKSIQMSRGLVKSFFLNIYVT